MTEANPFEALGGTFTPQTAQAPAAPVQQAPLQQGFQQAPAAPAAPAQGFQQAPVQQAPVQQAPVQQGYPQAPVQQGFPQAPAQGFQQAPVQQGYPQAPVQQGYPQATGFPQAAPVAPAAPLPPPMTASANAPTPAQAGLDAFGTSQERFDGEKHKIRTDLNQPVLFRIIESRIMPGKDGKDDYEVVFADWIVLDPQNHAERKRGMISNKPIVKDLKETMAKGLQFHVGRVIEVPSKFANSALALGPLTAEEVEFAKQAGVAYGWWEDPSQQGAQQ